MRRLTSMELVVLLKRIVQQRDFQRSGQQGIPTRMQYLCTLSACTYISIFILSSNINYKIIRH